MSLHKIETQIYKAILVEGAFEIRFYPSATMAVVSSHTKSYRELGYSGFGILSKYFFGANSSKKKIAMTSPIHLKIGDTFSSMAFVLPAKYSFNEVPKPDMAEIIIETSQPEYVAVLKFDGFASTANIQHQMENLKKMLKDKGLSCATHFRYLGYNRRYQMFGTKNEVVVALDSADFDSRKSTEPAMVDNHYHQIANVIEGIEL